jgi:hypothetical protein
MILFVKLLTFSFHIYNTQSLEVTKCFSVENVEKVSTSEEK